MQPNQKNQPATKGATLGYLAIALAATAYFDLWPMYQAAQGVPQFSVSLKGMALGWMVALVFTLFLIPERISGISRNKPTPANKERHVRGVRVFFVFWAIASIALTAFTWYFIHSRGYTINF